MDRGFYEYECWSKVKENVGQMPGEERRFPHIWPCAVKSVLALG